MLVKVVFTINILHVNVFISQYTKPGRKVTQGKLNGGFIEQQELAFRHFFRHINNHLNVVLLATQISCVF